MVDIRAKILSNERIVESYFKMRIVAPQIARTAKPGQFVQIRCDERFDPFLRRPFSIHRLSVIGHRLSVLELLYEVIGKGTEVLSRKGRGDFIDVLGPLGKGFLFPRMTDEARGRIILIAGGIGVAPLVFLAEKLKSRKPQSADRKIITFIGAKTKKVILCEANFKKIGAEVHIATDDGSRGYKGFVSGLFEEALGMRHELGQMMIYACGPYPMLRTIAKISKQGIDCQFSLEEEMACGIGVCLGCVVKLRQKQGVVNKLVCKDGPVFGANEILWNKDKLLNC